MICVFIFLVLQKPTTNKIPERKRKKRKQEIVLSINKKESCAITGIIFLQNEGK